MVEEEVFNKNPCYFYCVSGSVIRRWILEASTTPHGPWTTLRNHDEDNTFLNDVSSGNDKSLSFLYAPSSFGANPRGHAWPINISNDKWFSYFRLRNLQTHASSNRPYALYISGFELYGSVRAIKSYVYNPILMDEK